MHESLAVAPAARGFEQVLVDVATRAIRDALVSGHIRLPKHGTYSGELARPGATFVTLERDGKLLGCVGSVEAHRPLVVDVAHNAIAAAFMDSRVPPIDAIDYMQMSIKISLLSAHEPIAATTFDEVVEALRPHTDGLTITAGRNRATLLPSVWPKVADAADFCDILWRKAGLVPGTWPRSTKVWRYTTEEFGDPGPRTFAPREGEPTSR